MRIVNYLLRRFVLRIVAVAVLTPTIAHAQVINPLGPLVAQAGDAPMREPGYLGLIADGRGGTRGVRVVEVLPDTPAAAAGLRTGDQILLIDGKDIRSMDDFGRAIGSSSPGTKFRVQIERQGKEISFDVTFGKRPVLDARPFSEFGKIPEGATPAQRGGSAPGTLPAPGPRISGPAKAPAQAVPPPPSPALANHKAVLGVQAERVDDFARMRLGLTPGEVGAVVVGVAPGSPAEKAGIPVDSVIVSVENQRVVNADDLARFVQQAGAGRDVGIVYIERGQLKLQHVVLADGGVLADSARPSGVASNEPPDHPPLPAGTTEAAPSNGVLVLKQPTADAARVEQLEQRIRSLEQRISDLEAALMRAGTGQR